MPRIARPSTGTVLGLIAIVLALTGTAAAARHYLITSTSQIAPSVRSALHGETGARGRTGRRGPAGTPGPAGATGPAGAEGSAGPSGLQGPPGQDGAPGLDGIDGPQGPPGVAVARTSVVDGPLAVLASSTDLQVIRNPIPAAGRYVAVAKLTVLPSGPDEVRCRLVTTQSSIAGEDDTAVMGDGIEQTITLTYPADFAAPLSGGFAGYRVLCTTPVGTSATFQNAKITLLQTDTAAIVSGSPPVE